MALVVIEGVDKAGKTTLANTLVPLLEHDGRPVRLMHCGPPGPDPVSEYTQLFEKYTPEMEHLVVDRAHWGETVYGPIYRPGKQRYSVDCQKHTDMLIASRGGTVIHCEESLSVIRRRMKTDHETFLQPEHVVEVINGFHDAAERACCPNFTVKNASLYAEAITALARNRERVAAPLREFPSYIGRPDPRVLLIGDKRNENKSHYGCVSAFVPHTTSSGRYLFESLPTEFLRTAGVANAWDVDIGELWRALNKPRVVALGLEARNRIYEARIVCNVVVHPQWAKRFRNGERATYGRAIIDAAQRLPDQGPVVPRRLVHISDRLTVPEAPE